MIETVSERAYLDINIFREWFVRTIKGDATPIFYVEFLSEHTEIEKRISIFSIAEIVETLLKEPELQWEFYLFAGATGFILLVILRFYMYKKRYG